MDGVDAGSTAPGTMHAPWVAPETPATAWEVDVMSHVDDVSGGLVTTAAKAPVLVHLLSQAREVRGAVACVARPRVPAAQPTSHAAHTPPLSFSPSPCRTDSRSLRSPF